MAKTATLGPAPAGQRSRHEMESNMESNTPREVPAISVSGYGPMDADTAREMLETVARLNTENRELLARLDRVVENNHDNAVRVQDVFREEIDRLNAETERLNAETERLNAELASERNAHAETRSQVDRLRFAEIDPDDPRVSHVWEKAFRYASSAGFCSEFERIADALGIPQPAIGWTGTALVDVTVTVSVPVSGYANRAYINDGDVEVEEIDSYDIAEAMNNTTWERHQIGDWTVDSVEDVTADDD